MERINFGNQESRWEPSGGTEGRPLPGSSLVRPALDYTLDIVPQFPQTITGCKLEPYETLSPDCILTPVSLDGELDFSFSDPTSLPWLTSYSHDSELPPTLSEFNPQDVAKSMRKERRRAQNRKAQKAFRERKDRAIQRLEAEVEKLNAINQTLSTANEARLRDISKLRAELEERSSMSPTSRRNSCLEERDDVACKRESVSSDKTSPSAATTPIIPTETADVGGPFIKWRGKVYVEAESLIAQQPEECG